jgi:hypothetical protein
MIPATTVKRIITQRRKLRIAAKKDRWRNVESSQMLEAQSLANFGLNGKFNPRKAPFSPAFWTLTSPR